MDDDPGVGQLLAEGIATIGLLLVIHGAVLAWLLIRWLFAEQQP